MKLILPIQFLNRMIFVLALGLFLISGLSVQAQTNSAGNNTYSKEELITTGHKFFGVASGSIAQVIESLFSKYGSPTAYVTGEEASGAVVVGLRYGEGTLYMKQGANSKVYWQGPSIGFDLGGNAARTMTLVYNLTRPDELYRSYAGAEGTAYFIGGLGINVQERDGIVIASIRTGVGARLGVNMGYLKYTRKPTWNPL